MLVLFKGTNNLKLFWPLEIVEFFVFNQSYIDKIVLIEQKFDKVHHKLYLMVKK